MLSTTTLVPLLLLSAITVSAKPNSSEICSHDGDTCCTDTNDMCISNAGINISDASGMCAVVGNGTECVGTCRTRCSLGLPMCGPGEVCKNPLGSECDLATNDACYGYCDKAPKAAISCGGITGLDCPLNYLCVDKRGDGCNPDKGGADCIGECKQRCGLAVGQGCAKGKECHNYQGGGCDPETDENCVGFCRKKKTYCAGLTGVQCPAGLECVDRKVGCPIAADCPGVCRKLNSTTTPTPTMLPLPSTLTTSSYTFCPTLCADLVNACGVKYGG